MKECHIYLETSLKWPHKGNGIVGIIFTDKAEEHTKELFGQVKDSTENAAILYGLNKALTYVAAYDLIHVHTSCGYLVGGFKNLPSWNASSWKSSKGKAIKYAETWIEIFEKTNEKQIEIHLDEFNGYYKWLRNECDMRGRKHGFVLSGVSRTEK